jgi:hypothetical protein
MFDIGNNKLVHPDHISHAEFEEERGLLFLQVAGAGHVTVQGDKAREIWEKLKAKTEER